MEVTFGVPKQRGQREQRPYELKNVVVMYPAPAEKGGSFKFEITEGGCTFLGIQRTGDEFVALAFLKDGRAFVSAVAEDTPGAVRVTKTGTFSNKKYHSYLTKTFGIKGDAATQEYLFEITPAADVSNAFQLVSYVEETESTGDLVATETAEEVVADEAPVATEATEEQPLNWDN